MKTLLILSLIFLLGSCKQNRDKESQSPEVKVTHTHGMDEDTIAIPDTLSWRSTDTLEICSFNIQFLGHFKKRDNKALADILKGYDIVVVQELVSPPDDGSYPNGTTYKEDLEADAFFDAMEANGFSYILSSEDTGPGEEINKKSSGTEWWVSFYKPEAVSHNKELPQGYLAKDRSNHPDYDRVPFAFGFSSGNTDFVLISVHLRPDDSPEDVARRKHELSSIAKWIDANDDKEKDFIVLGDMNIENKEELKEVTPEGFTSLNDECRKTNTINTKDKPYDHVMYRPEFTSTEIHEAFDLEVVNLVEVMKHYWVAEEPYPGEPYNHNLFKQFYSDHHPVVFQMLVGGDDD